MTDNHNNDSISAAVIVDRRISSYVERIAIGLLSFIVTVMFFVYQGHQSDFKELQARVMTIQMDKVSRTDLKEVEDRINTNFNARIGELISRSTADKQDILQRLDIMISSGRYAPK
jgi:hypothetical protein